MKREKKQLSTANKPKKKRRKECELAKKTKKFNSKSLVDTTQKLIIKKLKLNVNHHIKIRKNHNLPSSLIMHSRAQNKLCKKN